MKKILRTFLFGCTLFASLTSSFTVHAKSAKIDFYQIKIYTLKNNEQLIAVDRFLKDAFLPAMHRAGILKIGVFKPIGNDTSLWKRVYVFIPFNSMNQWQNITGMLDKDVLYRSASKDFVAAAPDHVPFERIESILLDAFPMQPHFNVPSLKNSVTEKIYELRSYESPTEELHLIKVKMFNEGGETGLFKRLGFNAVFYGKVISGCRMPNLMYMTSFENMAEHDTHWKAFSNDAAWKKLKSMPEYQSKVSVSHIEIVLMHAAEYSDI